MHTVHCETSIYLDKGPNLATVVLSACLSDSGVFVV